MLFFKSRDVKDPVRDLWENAGYDFFVPSFDGDFRCQFAKDNEIAMSQGLVELHEDVIVVHPHGNVNIPSGIHSLFDQSIALVMFNKSGVALKKHLDVGACVVDASYEGEIHLNLTNTSNEDVGILPGEKIVQGVPLYIDRGPCKVLSKEDCSLDQFYAGHSSKRGKGGFGSTGTN